MLTKVFPGGSKGRVNRAGNAVRVGNASPEDLQVIEEWRVAHRPVLNAFQAILRSRTLGMDVVVAQRHKRKKTIFDKLTRHPKMELSRMDDITGCRLIFHSVHEPYAFRYALHQSGVNHKLKNHPDKYDYIKFPKGSGYRGIHDVYEYCVNAESGTQPSGLHVEIQYRTLIQHAWATAVEIVGFITNSQPKFQTGERKHHNAMALASEMLSRAYENRCNNFTSSDNYTIALNFALLNRNLNLTRKLRASKQIDAVDLGKQDAVLLISPTGDLDIHVAVNSTSALKLLFTFESKYPTHDVVLVKANTSNGIRLAFKNYFSDAIDFVELIEESCERLTETKLSELGRQRTYFRAEDA